MRAVTMTAAETRIDDTAGEPWDRLRRVLYERCQRLADEEREDLELYTADGIVVEAFVADRSAPYRAAVWTSRDRQRSIVFTNVEDAWSSRRGCSSTPTSTGGLRTPRRRSGVSGRSGTTGRSSTATCGRASGSSVSTASRP